eukprot:6200418-Pleurochrysis_carterae.AAC.2
MTVSATPLMESCSGEQTNCLPSRRLREGRNARHGQRSQQSARRDRYNIVKKQKKLNATALRPFQLMSVPQPSSCLRVLSKLKPPRPSVSARLSAAIAPR